MPYLLVYGFVVMSYLMDRYEYTPKSKFLNKVIGTKYVFLLMFLFAALRGNGNGDYFNYLEGAEVVNSFEFVINPGYYPFEIGFRLMSLISNTLKMPTQFVILGMNAISIYCVYSITMKYSRNGYLTALLFFPILLQFDMHHSRMAVAMSAGLWFVSFLYEKKYLKSLLMFLLALSFHNSSIILLVMVPLVVIPKVNELQVSLFRKPSKKMLAIVIIMGILVLINPLDIMVGILDNPLTKQLSIKISSYLANDRWSYPFSLLDPRIIQLFGIYVLISITYKYDDDYNNKLLIALFLAILSVLTLKSSTILTVRIYNYFNLFTVFLLPNIINSDKSYTIINKFKLNKLKVSDRVLVDALYDLVILSYIVYTFVIMIKQYEYILYF